MGLRKRFLASLAAALLAVPVVGTSAASATWFNWWNGQLGGGQEKYEGINHHTYATENYQTGPNACTSVAFIYFKCSGSGYSITWYQYAVGDPGGANFDGYNTHYDHLWWCSGSC
jgi:hypothetical protein